MQFHEFERRDRRQRVDRRIIQDRRESLERRDSPDWLPSHGRSEIAAELASKFAVVQQLCQRLANETHGTEYDLVLELNELLHEAHVQIALIETDSANDWPTTRFGGLDSPQ
jgi:hypothetical protein